MGYVSVKTRSNSIDIDNASYNISLYITSGKTFVDKSYDDINFSSGSLKEYSNTTYSAELNSSVTINKGKYNSNNKVLIPSISSYTSIGINGSSDSIFLGYNAYINGILVNGTGKTRAHNTALNAGVSTSQITVSWGYSAGWISGVAVCARTGSYNTTDPTSSRVYIGSGTSCTISGLLHSTTYYITIFPYCIVNNEYKWYSPSGTTVSAQALSIGTACSYCAQCNPNCSCNGLCSCNSTCGCNDHCNHIYYAKFC